MNRKAAIKFIAENNLIGLKAGHHRNTFLEIWMVVVNDRIFARHGVLLKTVGIILSLKIQPAR
jgi:hypothetical protein